MDITKINTAEKSEIGYEFELLYNGKKTGAFITIRGDKSPTVKKWARARLNEIQQRETAAKARGREAPPMTVEDAEEYGIEAAVIRVISWRGIMSGKEELACTPENVRLLLSKDDSFVEQILEESRVIGNFLKS